MWICWFQSSTVYSRLYSSPSKEPLFLTCPLTFTSMLVQLWSANTPLASLHSVVVLLIFKIAWVYWQCRRIYTVFSLSGRRHVFARPSGKRCLIVSSNGMTISRVRNGSILHRFPSALPNGSKRDISGPASSYSILDCIFHEVPQPNTFLFHLLQAAWFQTYLFVMFDGVCGAAWWNILYHWYDLLARLFTIWLHRRVQVFLGQL